MTTKTKRNTPPSSRDARNLPAHNARFARPAAVAESAFVRIADPAALTETLCVQEDRVVDRANTVSWGRLKLQLPQSPLRARFVKARVRVHEYPDGALAVFHGPRCITRYSARGEEISEVPTCIGLVTPCSPPSRTLRAAFGGGPRGPSLTAAALGVTGPMQVGTKKRPSGRTKKLSLKKAGKRGSSRDLGIGKHAQRRDLNTTNRHYIVPAVETGLPVRGSHTGRNRTKHENGVSNRISNTFRTGWPKSLVQLGGLEPPTS